MNEIKRNKAMTKFQYKSPSGLCFLESLAMVLEMPLESLVESGCESPAFEAIRHPKMAMIGGAIRRHAPWLDPTFIKLMTSGMKKPETDVPLPDSGSGIMLIWHPVLKGMYPDGALRGVHVMAFSDGTIYDPEKEKAFSTEEFQAWMRENEWIVVHVAAKPNITQA